MKKLTPLILILFVAPCFGEPYVDGSKSFLEIKDPNRQAEAWAMCAAAYDFAAELTADSKPAHSQKLSEMANGAKLAITMSIVSEGLREAANSDNIRERFSALWNMGKLAGESLPEISRTQLEVELESTPDGDVSIFLLNLFDTVDVCFRNAKAQQFYTDSWRDLYKSGMLKSPDE